MLENEFTDYMHSDTFGGDYNHGYYMFLFKSSKSEQFDKRIKLKLAMFKVLQRVVYDRWNRQNWRECYYNDKMMKYNLRVKFKERCLEFEGYKQIKHQIVEIPGSQYLHPFEHQQFDNLESIDINMRLVDS